MTSIANQNVIEDELTNLGLDPNNYLTSNLECENTYDTTDNVLITACSEGSQYGSETCNSQNNCYGFYKDSDNNVCYNTSEQNVSQVNCEESGPCGEKYTKLDGDCWPTSITKQTLNQTKCENKCSEDDDCKGYTYRPYGNECYIRTDSCDNPEKLSTPRGQQKYYQKNFDTCKCGTYYNKICNVDVNMNTNIVEPFSLNGEEEGEQGEQGEQGEDIFSIQTGCEDSENTVPESSYKTFLEEEDDKNFSGVIKNYNKYTSNIENILQEYSKDNIVSTTATTTQSEYDNATNNYLGNVGQVNSKLISNDNNKMIETFKINPSEKLLSMYDTKFNNSYKIMNEQKREIMTKNKLIFENKKKMINSSNKIFLLILLGSFLTLFCIYSAFYSFNIFPLSVLFVFSLITFLVFVIIIIKRFVFNTNRQLNKYNIETALELDNSVGQQYNNTVYNKSCPSQCTQQTEETDDVTMQHIVTKAPPRYLRTDSQRDVWIKGDLPNSTYTIADKNKRYRIDGELITGYNYDKEVYISPEVNVYRETEEELNENRPQRLYNPIDKKYATYYDCKFIGGDKNKSPIPFKESYKHTTIPCNYYPGFTETNRYICSSDPKKNPSALCQKI